MCFAVYAKEEGKSRPEEENQLISLLSYILNMDR